LSFVEDKPTHIQEQEPYVNSSGLEFLVLSFLKYIKNMAFPLKSLVALLLLPSIYASAQWTQLQSPSTFAVPFMIKHKDKAYAGIERGLFAGDRESTESYVFYPADATAIQLNCAASWGEYLITGTTNGKLTVYEDASTAQKLTTKTISIQSVTSVAVQDQVILAGTYEGVYRSVDTLKTVNLATNTTNIKGVNEIKIASNHNVYAASDSGIFVSDNQGLSWQKVPSPKGKINSTAFSADTLFAATQVGLYCSANQGASWLLHPFFGTQRISKLEQEQDQFLVYTQTDLYIRETVGAAWTMVQPGLAGQYTGMIQLGRTTLLCSYWGIAFADEGMPWQAARPSFKPTAANVQALTSDGTYLLGGTDTRGTFVSKDKGKSWLMQSHPFHHGAVYGVGTNTMVDGRWFSTTLKGVYRSDDSARTWSFKSQGLPNDQSIYSIKKAGGRLWVLGNKGLYSSTDYGDTWTASSTMVGATFYNMLELKSGKILLATNAGLYQREAFPSETWTKTDFQATASIYSLAQKGDTLYASTLGDGVYRSFDGGTNWTAINTGLVNKYISKIIANDTYAVSSNGLGDLFILSHADTTWRIFNGNLPESGILAYTIVSDTLYLSLNFSGIYKRALADYLTELRDEVYSEQNLFCPNPASSYIRFNEFAEIVEIEVYDALGVVKLKSTGTEVLSVGELPKGVYTVCIKTNKGIRRQQRLVKL
jgi:photosystem II stability/assembly factor-like uncharacterized protein